MTARRCVVAGGGTAGHIFVSLAVAGALSKGVGSQHEIELFGSARGLETALVAGSGFRLRLMGGRGIVRAMTPAAMWSNVAAIAGLALATIRATGRFLVARPWVVVSVGGYASVPAGIAAAALRVPLVLVSVDAVPGAAQRLLSRFAAGSAVAFEGTRLPKAVVTGAPLRAEVVAGTSLQRDEALASLALPPERKTVAIFGGSLGAGHLNDVALGLSSLWADRADRTVVHVCGTRNFASVSAAAFQAGHEGSGATLCYRLIGFQSDMASLYRAADVVVCRAGALSIAELALFGVPAVLVPLPNSPGDHQSKNAAALSQGGGALVIQDGSLDAAGLSGVLDDLLGSQGRLEAMARACKSMGRSDAAQAVAEVVRACAR
ncbi:MAG: UDP-N-acetylglucosamine--N-acetylmuramyl-(pentapeptide) pyrophosphoryl-undecaprenol N-acetylglucosamine transferase [Acidimicrobiales bacterium]